MLKVRWFYSKPDLQSLLKQELSEDEFQLMADNEIFGTTHQDKVFADAISAKAKVVSFQTYLEMSVDDRANAFYSRSAYNQAAGALEPAI